MASKRKRESRKVLKPFVVGGAPGRRKKAAGAVQSEKVVRGFLAATKKLADAARTKAHSQKMLEAAQTIAAQLRRREEEISRLVRLTERINYGVSLDETLEFAWRELAGVIPYNRIGFSLIHEEKQLVVARWARSDRAMKLVDGYQGRLEGSTLKRILATGRPRVINDLSEYLRRKPASHSTRLIVEEGMRSSLTCPLIVQGKPVGFMFFSSVERNAYSDAHVEFFQQIAGMLSAVVEKGKLYTELAEQKGVIERQNARMTRDLDMARQVQRALIPKKVPDSKGLEIAFEYEPAIQVGGDVLDVIALDERRVVLFLGDAVGHGVPAALIMSAVKASLHSAVANDPRPAALLKGINRTLSDLLSFHFVTAACALMDRETRKAEIALAGHAPPVWFHAATGEVSSPGDGDLPLGVQRDTEYAAVDIALAPGDVLLFVTDGITESMDPDDDQYGAERLTGCVLASGCDSAAGILSSVLRDVHAHARGREPSDDMTMLAVKASP
jgi:serine phosphatase RsbU (regulator of sigma subunit)